MDCGVHGRRQAGFKQLHDPMMIAVLPRALDRCGSTASRGLLSTSAAPKQGLEVLDPQNLEESPKPETNFQLMS